VSLATDHDRPATRGEGAPVPHVRVAILGTGFAGLVMALRLREAGETDFVLLERADDIGGTWRDNTYPGCACDVPSALYSISFAPNPDWSFAFSRQPEIQAYMQRVVTDRGLRPHLRLRHEVLEARWDDAASRWHVHTSAGDLTADVLVSGSGALADPVLPDIPGLDTFPGPVFHSARWRHDVELAGKRVAAIGTGASAIQFIPEVAKEAAHVTVFQRTAAWVVPRLDFPISERWKRRFRRHPRLQTAFRGLVYGIAESQVYGFVRRPDFLDWQKRQALWQLKKHIEDPELRARLTPDYHIGCKRILRSSDFYPALARPNVSVTGGLREVRGATLVAADGSEHTADVLVLGTGFHASDIPIAKRIVGRDGQRLSDRWEGGVRTLRGITATGCPNLFFLVGPNTVLGHSSIIYMIESQVTYVMDALRHRAARGAATVEPTEAAERAWDDEVQDKLQGTVWNTGGCRSWYLDDNGRNTTLWPGATWAYRRATRRFDPREYRLEPARRGVAVG
jgi:cation diffusion facilitator CzcD-associated flavoprotein CzcO